MNTIFKTLAVLFFLFFSTEVFAKDFKIAIFDYDIRPENEMTVAKHIEKQLLESSLSIKVIDQFSGKEDEKITTDILSELDNSGYDLIITITSDAMIPAQHKIKKTSWLFTNVNNPVFFGIKNLKKPGRNRSGVTYYIPVKRQLEFYREVLGGKLNKIGLIFDQNASSMKAETGGIPNLCKILGNRLQN